MKRFSASLTLCSLLVACSSKTPTPTLNSPKVEQAKSQAPPPDPHAVAPEVVRVEQVSFLNGVKNITVSNTTGKYHLACNASQENCVTPAPGRSYYLFDKSTKWILNPESKKYVTLAWLQGWSITYTNQENIALVPESNADPGQLGMYWLVSWEKN